MCEHFLVWRRCFRVALYFTLEFAQHDELVRFRRSLCPIDFQIAQHQRALAVLLEKNERISDKNTGRVEHIRIGVAGRNDEASGLILLCHETTVGQRFLAANVSIRRHAHPTVRQCFGRGGSPNRPSAVSVCPSSVFSAEDSGLSKIAPSLSFPPPVTAAATMP